MINPNRRNRWLISLLEKQRSLREVGEELAGRLQLHMRMKAQDIALVSRTKEQLDEVAGEIEKTGRKAIAIPTDITDPAQVEAMAGKVNDAFGTIDILINNAGGGIERRSILESEPDEWVKDVTLNLISVYLVTRALLPLLIKAGGGHIINTGSGAGYSAGALRSAYRVGKAGHVDVHQVPRRGNLGARNQRK